MSDAVTTSNWPRNDNVRIESILPARALWIVAGFIAAVGASHASAAEFRQVPISSHGTCYSIVKQNGGPSINQMPPVCPALLQDLNSACTQPRKPYRLTIATTAKGLTLPKWESVPVTADVMPLIERLVRSRWNVVYPPLKVSEGSEKWRTRADQEWDVARTAIARAQQQGQKVLFDRTDVQFRGRTSSTALYRLSIAKPILSIADSTKLANSIELYVLMLGTVPELYLGEAADQLSLWQSGSTQNEPLNGALFKGVTEVINYDGVVYGLSLGGAKGKDIGLIGYKLVTIPAGSYSKMPKPEELSLLRKDICGFKYRPHQKSNGDQS